MRTIRTIIEKLRDKKILLLGFGREGKSSYRFIRKHIPQAFITIADREDIVDTSLFRNDSHVDLWTGDAYLDRIDRYDIALLSPGISLKDKDIFSYRTKISSQADLFLQAFAAQSIGITGTKGKSTTSYFIYHILKQLKKEVVIAGNMGIPFFDIVPTLTPETHIVLELSSHQLEFISKSPHISVLLNLYQEHLDHYHSFSDYQQAKFNIARYQSEEDYFVYNTNDDLTHTLLKTTDIKSHLVGFSLWEDQKTDSYIRDHSFYFRRDGQEQKAGDITNEFPLKGEHNLLNTTAVIAALRCFINPTRIDNALYSFKGLEHRLELIGEVEGIIFYNDSISTIAQATIAAINALHNVNTLILGGFDRGIDYVPLIDFLESSQIEHLIFTGDAGKRMMQLSGNLKGKQLFFRESYTDIVTLAKRCTKRGAICLLSPAAASYDQFQNFEHRGNTFRQLLLKA
jgi:UDP-N-acetylmuramoylalanine--D-glutamate ligase